MGALIPAALLACALNVHPVTLEAIVRVESGGNPLALNVNTLAGPLRVLPGADGSLRPYVLTTLLTVGAALQLSWRGAARRAEHTHDSIAPALEER